MRNDFKQEILDRVSKHLFKQNERAVDEEGSCKYRLGNLKCAAGILISDCDYSPEMEMYLARTLPYFPESGYSDDEIKLISELQSIHDMSSVSLWKFKLKELAIKHDLVFES